jgi:hypothetical protein
MAANYWGPNPYQASPIKSAQRKRRTRTEMAALRDGLFAIVEADHPTTNRSVLYQAAAQGLVEKTEQEYQSTVCRLLLEMRRSGRLPYDWIADNTRWMHKPQSYNSLDQMLAISAATYRRALWLNQPVYVEIWCEKDTIAGVLLEETEPYDVPLMVARGFASESYLYSAAQAIIAREKPAYIYYFGDHDPSGLLISQAIERGLRRLAPDAEIHFEREAVAPWQIIAWDLPSRPTKESSHSARGFAGPSVDIDAVPSRTLRALVRTCILRHLDGGALVEIEQAEQSERDILARIRQHYEDAS